MPRKSGEGQDDDVEAQASAEKAAKANETATKDGMKKLKGLRKHVKKAGSDEALKDFIKAVDVLETRMKTSTRQMKAVADFIKG